MDLKLQNVFAALDGKKKSKKEGSEKKTAAGSKRPGKKVALDETLWQKTQISVSWADCDDEDDGDDAAASGPPPVETDTAKPDDPQEVDSNDGDNASDGAPEEEHEAEEEGLVPAEAPAPGPKAGKAAEPDRQLSKKELKKKELDDMDAILAELGIQVAPATNGGAAGAEAGLSKTAQRKLKKQQQASQPDSVSPDAAEAAPPAIDAEVDGTSAVAVDALEVKRRIAAANAKAKPSKSGSAATTALAEAKARAEKAKKSSGDKKATYDR